MLADGPILRGRLVGSRRYYGTCMDDDDNDNEMTTSNPAKHSDASFVNSKRKFPVPLPNDYYFLSFKQSIIVVDGRTM